MERRELLGTVRIDNLRVRAILGVHDWEREVRQELLINIEFSYDIAQAAATDDFIHAVDYKQMKQRVIALVENSNCFLIEKLAADVLATVLEPEAVLGACVRIDKPGALRYCDSVSVEVCG